MIRLENVSFAYQDEPVLRGVSCTLENGCLTAIIGANGSGKSTMLRLCAGQLRPKSGRVLAESREAAAYTPKAFARAVAYLPQDRPVPMISVKSLVSHGRFPYLGMTRRLNPADEVAVARAMEACGVAALDSRELRTLSGGQRQKAYLAMLMAQGAQSLLLDEPTTYLDVRHQLELMALLRSLTEEGRCVAAVLHDLRQAASCDRVLVLEQGSILYDGPGSGLYESGALERAFGIRAVPGTEAGFVPMEKAPDGL